MLPACALTVAILAGCDSGDAAGGEIDKAEFVKRANAICEATQMKLLSRGLLVFRRISRGKSKSEAEAIFVPKWLVPVIRAEVEEVRALGAPAGDEAEVDAIFDELESVLDEAEANPTRFNYEQAHFSRPYRTSERLANEYGIWACGHP